MKEEIQAGSQEVRPEDWDGQRGEGLGRDQAAGTRRRAHPPPDVAAEAVELSVEAHEAVAEDVKAPARGRGFRGLRGARDHQLVAAQLEGAGLQAQQLGQGQQGQLAVARPQAAQLPRRDGGQARPGRRRAFQTRHGPARAPAVDGPRQGPGAPTRSAPRPGRRSGAAGPPARRRGAKLCRHRAEKAAPAPRGPFIRPAPLPALGHDPRRSGRVSASQDLAAPARSQGLLIPLGCAAPRLGLVPPLPGHCLGGDTLPVGTLPEWGGHCRAGGHCRGRTLPEVGGRCREGEWGEAEGGAGDSTGGAGSGPRWEGGRAAPTLPQSTTLHRTGQREARVPLPAPHQGPARPGSAGPLTRLPRPAPKLESVANHRLLISVSAFSLPDHFLRFPPSQPFPAPFLPLNLLPKSQPLHTGAQWHLGDRASGGVAQNSFITLPGRGGHSRLVPSVSRPDEGFDNNGSRVGLLRGFGRE